MGNEMERLGQLLGLKIYAETKIATDNWVNEFGIANEYQIPQDVPAFMILESILFLVYFYKIKFRDNFSEEEFNIFSENVLDGAVFSFSEFYMENMPTEEIKKLQQEQENEFIEYDGDKTDLLLEMIERGLVNYNWQFEDGTLANYVETVTKKALESDFEDITNL